MHTAIFPTPIGILGLQIQDHHLHQIDFLPSGTPLLTAQNEIAQHIQQQLMTYFSNPSHTFQAPLSLHGTDFQKKVWNALSEIPAGKPTTYGELAKKLKTSARAVGNACRSNPIPIIIPCHRVIGKSGIGGYMGQTTGTEINTKLYLLKHESIS